MMDYTLPVAQQWYRFQDMVHEELPFVISESGTPRLENFSQEVQDLYHGLLPLAQVMSRGRAIMTVMLGDGGLENMVEFSKHVVWSFIEAPTALYPYHTEIVREAQLRALKGE